ncbi:host nuclease inhibitor GamL [Escherichia coli]
MNAYLTYDRIEDRRWAEQQITDEKEKWIDDRAQKIIDMMFISSASACIAFMASSALMRSCSASHSVSGRRVASRSSSQASTNRLISASAGRTASFRRFRYSRPGFSIAVLLRDTCAAREATRSRPFFVDRSGTSFTAWRICSRYASRPPAT